MTEVLNDSTPCHTILIDTRQHVYAWWQNIYIPWPVLLHIYRKHVWRTFILCENCVILFIFLYEHNFRYICINICL